jgi:four helix bundle protein
VIKSFEDIVAWQKGIELSKLIYQVSNSTQLSKDFGLRDKMRRASVSVPSNIAGGFERKENKEFIQFMYVSLGSLAELQTQTIICFELNYIDEENKYIIISKVMEIRKMLTAFQSVLKNSEYKGEKFK